jgi:hypothetical protein
LTDVLLLLLLLLPCNQHQAFIMAGLKYKLGSRPEDMQRIMQNTCLINAILKQHIIPGT